MREGEGELSITVEKLRVLQLYLPYLNICSKNAILTTLLYGNLQKLENLFGPALGEKVISL